MFFYLSKLFWFFAAPSNLLVLLSLAGLWLAMHRPKAGLRLAGACLLLLLVAGISPLGSILLLPLEERFAQRKLNDLPPVNGIIVLGGALDDQSTSQRQGLLELTEAGDRILALIALARRFPETRIIFTGGAADVLETTTEPEAEAVKRRIALFGIEPDRIIFESQSRNTHENALFTRDLLQPKPGETFLIVTSAFHMPRSIGIFRQAGFRVMAFPVDYRTGSTRDALRFEPTIAEGLRQTDIAMREWMGLAAYWLTGRTDAVFPGP